MEEEPEEEDEKMTIRELAQQLKDEGESWMMDALDKVDRVNERDPRLDEFWGSHGNGRVDTSFRDDDNFDDWESDDYGFDDC